MKLYYERHGEGAPLVLIHGGLGTIESCFAGLLPELAKRFEVIAVELQGHGHTPDIDRPFSIEAMAGDVAQLLDSLDLAAVHVVGYSVGGAVGVQLTLDRPDLVGRLVFAGGATFDTSAGLLPELNAGFEDFDPHAMDGTSWHESYVRVAPDPLAWPALVTKMNELDRAGIAWSPDRIAGLGVPTLLIVGDDDIVRLEHVVEFFHLLGGGRLAVLPGTDHVGLLERVDWLSSMIGDFLTC